MAETKLQLVLVLALVLMAAAATPCSARPIRSYANGEADLRKPCHMGGSSSPPRMEVYHVHDESLGSTRDFTEKYGRLILNLLPKGRPPPSGPSLGGNNMRT